MIIGVSFITCSIIFLSLICFAYFSKKTINTFETRIYTKLLSLNMIGLILELGCSFTVSHMSMMPLLNEIINRAFLVYFASFISLFTLYVYIISKKRDKLYYETKEIFSSKEKVIFTILYILLLISVLFLKLEYYYDGNAVYSYGLAVDVITYASGFYLILDLIFVVPNIKHIPRKKLAPLLALFVFLVMAFFIRLLNPSIILITCSFAYVTTIMYFTIENPDLKILNEYVRNKELASANIEDKTNLLFKISQDVKNPLSKVEMLSNRILKEDNMHDIKSDAYNIKVLTKDVNDTINKVLNISEIDISKIKITSTTYNFYNLFNQIILTVMDKMDKKVDFKYSMSSLVPKTMYGDALKLKQVIYSLIANSMKHTDKGYVDLDVSAIIRNDICRLLITISDTGEAIPLDKVNALLDDKEPLKDEEVDKIKETEVDLRIVKKIIDAFGGTLLIRGEENVGTTYSVILDQKIDDSNLLMESAKNSLGVISNKKKVLLIDDDYKELELYTRELKANNYEVTSTMYGKDGIDKINNGNSYDYVFIDDEMEYKNAVELIKEIDTKKMKVIVMLDPSKEFIKEHYLNDYKFYDYLLKRNYQSEIKRIKNKG